MDNQFLNIDKKLSRFRIILSFIFVVIISLYVANVLFGKSSFDVLTKLERQEDSLIKEVNFFLKNNARLQKEYFELKNLEQ